jgi:hypothetical protein
MILIFFNLGFFFWFIISSFSFQEIYSFCSFELGLCSSPFIFKFLHFHFVIAIVHLHFMITLSLWSSLLYVKSMQVGSCGHRYWFHHACIRKFLLCFCKNISNLVVVTLVFIVVVVTNFGFVTSHLQFIYLLK